MNNCDANYNELVQEGRKEEDEAEKRLCVDGFGQATISSPVAAASLPFGYLFGSVPNFEGARVRRPFRKTCMASNRKKKTKKKKKGPMGQQNTNLEKVKGSISKTVTVRID